MTRCFTHYWTNETWEATRKEGTKKLTYTASNQFRERGVRPGDFIYVVTIKAGRAFLACRLPVEFLVDRGEAKRRLHPRKLYPKKQFAIAPEHAPPPLDLDRVVPTAIARRLRLVASGVEQALVFDSDGKLDRQTLRGVRELTSKSVGLLDSLLGLEAGASRTTEEIVDERRRRKRAVVQRLGRAAFRKKLLQAYEGRCAITGCDVVEALQAAHIVSYRGLTSNLITNGILLRADIHNLFDLDLLTIDPDTMTVRLASSLLGTIYSQFDGRRLRLPADPACRPNPEFLRVRLRNGVGDAST